MKLIVPVLAFLLAFIATGRSLRCMECMNISGGFCKGKSHECSARATSCMKTLAIMRIGDEIYKSFRQACNDDEHLCDQDLIINSGHQNKQLRTVTKCCTTDNCNRCRMKVPPYNTTANGLICPVCYNDDSDECGSTGYMICRGHETECIDMATTMYKQDTSKFKFSLMGCTTLGGCSLGNKIVPGSKIVEAKRMLCYDAAPIIHW